MLTQTTTGRSQSDTLYLVMLAVLPLHTVFLSAWISWKPFIVVLAVLIAVDVTEGVRTRRWPYHKTVSVALLVFGLVVLTGFPAAPFRERFLRLGLALAVGAMVMLVTDRRIRRPGMWESALSVIFWTGAAMGLTALLLSLVNLGVFGADVLNGLNDLPGVFRVSKPAYLADGFIALTNWHQDPGYGAAWSVLWASLALVAVARGRGSGRTWLDVSAIGLLGLAVVMAFSRTGWLSFPLGIGIVSFALVRSGVVAWRWLAMRLVGATVVTILAIGTMFVVDPPLVAGDIDLQFAFRLSQGWDLLADITGLFESSDAAFGDRFQPSEERADVWPEYIEMFLDHPIRGVGLGVGWLTNSILQEPHNLALELLAETGIIGLAAFLAVLVTIARSGSGRVAGALMIVTFLPAMTQTVLFEPTWWFAAGLYLSSVTSTHDVTQDEPARLSS